MPGNEGVKEDIDDSLAIWTFPDGYAEVITPGSVRVTRMPDDLPHPWGRHAPPRFWHVDVLMVGRPTPCDRWEVLTPPGGHWRPSRGEAPPEYQAADDKRELEIRERHEGE